MKKQIICLVLALALLLCLLPATAMAVLENGGSIIGEYTIDASVLEAVAEDRDLTVSQTATLTVKGKLTVAGTLEVTGGKVIVADGGAINVAGKGKIIVSDGGTLEIQSGVEGGTVNLSGSSITGTSATDGSDRILQIASGATLDIYGTLQMKLADFSDILQLGTMKIHGTTGSVKLGGGATYIGSDGLVKLGEDAVVTSTPIGSSFTEGYTYTISGGTATTAQANGTPFAVTGKDQFVVASGATLVAPAGTFVLSTDTYTKSVSTTPLTINEGGTLDADETVLAIAYGYDAIADINKAHITSGTYSSNPQTYVANGYAVVTETVDNKTVYKIVKKEISGVAVTVGVPTLGGTVDSKPTYTVVKSPASDEADAVRFFHIWVKIPTDKYTGKAECMSEAVPMADGEKFTTGYVYIFAAQFKKFDDYAISQDITGTINGNASSNLYGDSIVTEMNGVYFIILTAVYGPFTTPAAETTTATTAVNAPATDDGSTLTLWVAFAIASCGALWLVLSKKRSR